MRGQEIAFCTRKLRTLDQRYVSAQRAEKKEATPVERMQVGIGGVDKRRTAEMSRTGMCRQATTALRRAQSSISTRQVPTVVPGTVLTVVWA